ncbi:MAG: hypothetical protein QOF89_1871 [Acidobacteriota bacterium]|nr:hypothetical protein [Acidobacteriota bacterium]
MIGAVAFDPDDSAIAYAGTGEGNGFNNLSLGILKSEDGGTTWREMPDRQFDQTGFFDLLPLGGSRILAATTNGLWLSSDGGESWTRLFRAPTWSFSRLPEGGEILAASEDGLRFSFDGELWGSVGLPLSPERWTRMAVCHSPQNSAVAYVFAVSGGEEGDVHLWRRDPRNGGFQEVLIPRIAPGSAGFNWVAAAAPGPRGSRETLFLGSVPLFRGVRLESGAWRWSNVSDRNDGDSIHVDQHAVVFDPQTPGTLYVGNDGGVFRSRDTGETWESLNRGLAITETLFLAQDPRSADKLLAGTQDNGTLRYDGSPVWRLVAVGDGGPCAIQQETPYLYFHTFAHLTLERSNREGDRDTWDRLWKDRPERSSLFYPPMRVLGDVVVQAGETVQISSDAGNHFTEVDLPAGSGLASAIEIVDRDRILVGTETGDLYRIDRNPAGWDHPIPLLQPRAGFISSILAADRDHLWVAYSDAPGPGQGQIFRSVTGGQDWEDLSIRKLKQDFELPVNVIRADPADPNVLYAGTEFGVFRYEGGWMDLSEGLPHVMVKDLVFYAPGRRLRAATASRGVWEIVLPS